MSWESCTSDILRRTELLTLGGYSNMRMTYAYRLFADSSNEDNVKIRIDISYFHVYISLLDTIQGGGFWNCLGISWFLGNYPDMLNQTQLDLNKQRDEDGYYIHDFSWPYYSSKDGSYEDTLPFSQLKGINEINSVMYNNLPILAVSVPDNITSFDSSRFSYSIDASGFTDSLDAILWGYIFKDTNKLNGSNRNGQNKVLVTGNRIDIATSALLTSGGKYLTYTEEENYNLSDLEVAESYYSSDALCSIEIDEQTLDNKGLLRYDPDNFKTDQSYDPYIIHAYVIPTTCWDRYRGQDLVSKIDRLHASESEIQLKYEDDVLVPDVPLPDPVLEIDDNTVFRLQKQFDSQGNVITDQNGYAILKWIKCEEIGEK